ncbi:MAG: alpha/beta fold hydrolase [Bacteroidales bacterium]|nr:alpha/beta fold hydrolase [Bacteroidales bacterium]
MRNERYFIKLASLVLIFSSFIISCTKETADPDYRNFVSKEVALQLTKEYLGALVDAASEANPEAASVKPLIASDITVYKIVYKTTVDNQEINASGLVCVPATPGDYPVLSFQNGTNTVNAYAPSQFPSDYSYQMIELIASLGYIVVISDYPGFGASASIPHPYLVKEPTVRSLVDNLSAVKELAESELPGINLINEYYLLGYSQGGWATLALHKALETDFSSDFDLIGSACGAGPYNIYLLLQDMINVTTYPMPVYLGYIVNAYTAYNQFTNPVTDILNEPYATRISSLYTGILTSGQINNQLTTTISDLINPGFLAGFESDPAYSSVRNALGNNSIAAWHTYKPLLLLHGSADTHVNPISTEDIYNGMIEAGTSPDLCSKVIIPGADHGGGVVPAMIQGILFLNDLKTSR